MFKSTVIFVVIFAVSLAFPKSTPQTVFIHPNERLNKLYNTQLGIFNGQTAYPNQFPYQVGIYIPLKGYTNFCGGSLISNDYVLTAAHCIDKATEVTLVFGAHNITDPDEKTQSRMTSRDFTVHEQWNRSALMNDIALIKLPEPIKETHVVKIVPIASGSDNHAYDEAYVAGWGVTRSSQQGVYPILNYIKSTIMTNRECKETDDDYNKVITDKLLCLSPGYNKLATMATCKGDSGGPLTTTSGIQVGIVSFGARDCEEGKPSVFTRISKYYDWIVENADLNFNTN